MSEDWDVEALLEAPYKKEDEASSKYNGSHHADKENRKKYRGGSRSPSRSSKKKKRSRSRSPTHDKRSGSRDRRSRSRDRGERRRNHSRERPRRSRSRDRRRVSPVRPRKERRRTRSRSMERHRHNRDYRSRSRSPRREHRRLGRNDDVTAYGTKPGRGNKTVGRNDDVAAYGTKPSRGNKTVGRNDDVAAYDTKAGRGSKTHRSRSRSPVRRRSPPRSPHGLNVFDSIRNKLPNDDISPEDRDLRTIFVMRLSQRVRARDLEEFFSAVGPVRDVKIIMDNKTRRSKGIAYVEFASVDSIPLALGLHEQELMGCRIHVQLSQAEKNRTASSASSIPKGAPGPMRLYVGSLHFNITEDMLRGIFEPFGKIERIELIKDPETGRSKGYGFISFYDSEDAKKALEQLNGFELAGRPMKVGHVTERTDLAQGPSFLDSDELDRTGIDLGATGRLQLMAKLAEGTDLNIPSAAVQALQMSQGVINPQQAITPPIATQCFMLSNMFDPLTETNPSWDEEIRNDVIEECKKHGGAMHVFVDKSTPQGNVYVKCPTISAAVASVTALHGRWFAGRIITAAYVPVVNYHSLFPDSIVAPVLM